MLSSTAGNEAVSQSAGIADEADSSRRSSNPAKLLMVAVESTQRRSVSMATAAPAWARVLMWFLSLRGGRGARGSDETARALGGRQRGGEEEEEEGVELWEESEARGSGERGEGKSSSSSSSSRPPQRFKLVGL